MSNSAYDFIIVGRWRNRDKVNELRDALRAADKAVYCFTDHDYDGDGIKFETRANADVEKMVSDTEDLTNWQQNATFRKIFENDMTGLKNATNLVIVFPAGLSAHMELGVAYGMSKPCYAVGEPDKTEPLYFMIDKFFPNVKALVGHMA